MTLALFDLDHTLLNGDSDYLWGNFLVNKGLVDAEAHAKANQQFYQQYQQGQLDIHEYAAFSMRFLAENEQDTLIKLHQEFMQTVILPKISIQARQLVEKHRDLGHTLVIITATNSFITRPIADELGIPHLLATEPKMVQERYIAEISGVPSFKEGKVIRLKAWLQQQKTTLANSFFYSDSHNDLPLLSIVDHPIVVDPDSKLLEIAKQRYWPILYLHGN